MAAAAGGGDGAPGERKRRAATSGVSACIFQRRNFFRVASRGTLNARIGKKVTERNSGSLGSALSSPDGRLQRSQIKSLKHRPPELSRARRAPVKNFAHAHAGECESLLPRVRITDAVTLRSRRALNDQPATDRPTDDGPIEADGRRDGKVLLILYRGKSRRRFCAPMRPVSRQ